MSDIKDTKIKTEDHDAPVTTDTGSPSHSSIVGKPEHPHDAATAENKGAAQITN